MPGIMSISKETPRLLVISVLLMATGCINKESANTSTSVSSIPLEDVVVDITPSTEMLFIEAEPYTPMYGRDSVLVEIEDFYIDQYPVTNEDFRQFLLKNPFWRKSNLRQIFADDNYLNNWINDTTYGINADPNAPVTNVSWFAAQAYAKCVGKRLPTVDEWEFVALSDAEVVDARVKESYNEDLLSWYESKNTFLNTVGQNAPNYWNVYDIHGLVWEWTLDFNSIMMTGESRKDGANDNKLFCGSASIGAADKMNYAAFIRYAFRGSLKANYCVRSLGFRCAKSITDSK